ncbi:Synaptic vesicle membrane protein VAT-1 like-like, partial [Pseudolycoriella hygida]
MIFPSKSSFKKKLSNVLKIENNAKMTEITETPAAQAPEDQKPVEETNAEEATNGNHNGEPETNGETQEEVTEKPEPPKEMRAIVLTSFGGFKGLKVLKKPEPTPQAGEVLIRVKACGLNFQDLIVRLGAIDSPPKTPCILGFECAGEIEAVGEGVTKFEVGDRVVALPEFKAWAELVSVPETFVYKIPENMTFTEAAAITLNYLVAHILVNDLAVIRPGNSVLLHSAGGGV